jgi:hypothetical protein
MDLRFMVDKEIAGGFYFNDRLGGVSFWRKENNRQSGLFPDDSKIKFIKHPVSFRSGYPAMGLRPMKECRRYSCMRVIR